MRIWGRCRSARSGSELGSVVEQLLPRYEILEAVRRRQNVTRSRIERASLPTRHSSPLDAFSGTLLESGNRTTFATSITE